MTEIVRNIPFKAPSGDDNIPLKTPSGDDNIPLKTPSGDDNIANFFICISMNENSMKRYKFCA